MSELFFHKIAPPKKNYTTKTGTLIPRKSWSRGILPPDFNGGDNRPHSSCNALRDLPFNSLIFLMSRRMGCPNPDIEKIDVTNYEDLERFF